MYMNESLLIIVHRTHELPYYKIQKIEIDSRNKHNCVTFNYFVFFHHCYYNWYFVDCCKLTYLHISFFWSVVSNRKKNSECTNIRSQQLQCNCMWMWILNCIVWSVQFQQFRFKFLIEWIWSCAWNCVALNFLFKKNSLQQF